jgi:hypothetical protein
MAGGGIPCCGQFTLARLGHSSQEHERAESLRVLVHDGFMTRLGDRVGCSRAAVRFDARYDALAPISSVRAS